LIGAAGALLQYLSSLRGGSPPEQIVTFRPYSPGSGMVLDTATRRNLGLDDLIETIDRTRTPMGQRALRRWIERPLLEVDRINQRLEAVDALVSDYMLREEAREQLGSIPDIERIATRIVRLSASPNDLLSLKSALEAIGPLKEALAPAVPEGSLLSRTLRAVEEPPGVRELIGTAMSEESGEIIRAGYSSELDEAREFRGRRAPEDGPQDLEGRLPGWRGLLYRGRGQGGSLRPGPLRAPQGPQAQRPLRHGGVKGARIEDAHRA
jgi:DNA mismatch repair protein MutS